MRLLASALVATLLLSVPAFAADHADSPLLSSIPRHDAKITDVYVFSKGDGLVMAMCTNPTVANASSYTFPEDLTARFHIDTDSDVSYDDAAANAQFGGALLDPDKVSAEIVLEVTFDAGGNASLRREGLASSVPVQLFAGLRDDPFIRRPRMGANTPCIVAEVPLSAVVGSQSTLLVWGSTKIPDVHGPISEHGGRALRSMFGINDAMNTSSPRNHYRMHGLVPDVMIYDTSRAAAYPNGRALEDDVVDLVNDLPTPGGVLPGEGPDFPSVNDRAFLADFPYLAEPHPKP